MDQTLIKSTIKILIIITLHIIFGCSDPYNKSTEQEVQDTKNINKEQEVLKNKDFEEFISLLPNIKLPFSVYCEDCCDMANIDPENPNISKYIPEGAFPAGLIYSYEEFVVIMVTYPGDMRIPSLIVYNLKGEITDEKNFMTGFCGKEHDSLKKQYLSINKDLVICATDTVYTFKTDPTTNKITDTSKIEVKVSNYVISNNGKIKETQNSQELIRLSAS